MSKVAKPRLLMSRAESGAPQARRRVRLTQELA
jgi:hypothetical protein